MLKAFLFILFINLQCLAFAWDERVSITQHDKVSNTITKSELINDLSKSELLHNKGDKSLGVKPFDYPALDISVLWDKLGIKPKKTGEKSYLFDCAPQANKCYIPDPYVKTIQLKKIDIVSLVSKGAWDYQYFVFLNGAYIDQISFDSQKNEPEIRWLDNDLFSITILVGSGTNYIEFLTILYNVNNKSLKKVFTFTSMQERSDWGMLFDEKVDSKFSYLKEELKINYDITLTINGDPNGLGYKRNGDLIVLSHKTINLERIGDQFKIESSKSDFTLKGIDKLVNQGGYEAYYRAFKSNIDAFAKGDNWSREWYRLFKKYLKEEVKGKGR